MPSIVLADRPYRPRQPDGTARCDMRFRLRPQLTDPTKSGKRRFLLIRALIL